MGDANILDSAVIPIMVGRLAQQHGLQGKIGCCSGAFTLYATCSQTCTCVGKDVGKIAHILFLPPVG